MCSLLIALLAGVACCRKAMLKKAKLKEAGMDDWEGTAREVLALLIVVGWNLIYN